MQNALRVVLGVLLLSATVRAQDAFPLGNAQIVDAPDVSGWRQTATITQLSFNGSETAVSFTKQWDADRWPDVVPAGWTGPLQYTLWLFLQVNGQWVGSGFVQFWYGRNASGNSAQPDVPSLYHLNYFYSSRWRPMDTHGPIRPNEPIAFMVTSGNARDAVGPYGPMERSNVVVVPATDNGVFTFAASVPPPIPPAPSVPPPGPPAPLPPVPSLPLPPPVVTTDPLLPQIVTLMQQIAASQARTEPLITETHTQVVELNRTVGQTFKDISIFVSKYIMPAVAAWYAGKAVAK